MSNVIDFPPRPCHMLVSSGICGKSAESAADASGDPPLCRPVLCQIDPSVRVVDLARALSAGGFCIVHNPTADTILIKAASQGSQP